MMTKKVTVFLGCIVLVLIILVVVKSLKNKGKNQYKTITPTVRTIERKIIFPGMIVPSKEIEIKSTISGVMEQLYVRVGDHIAKGQAIAQIKFVSEPKEYQSYLRRFQIAEAQYENSKNNFERNEILYGKKVIAKADYEVALTNYLTTKAEHDAALKELQFVEGIQTEASGISNIIYSTDDGAVLELPIKEGGSIMARGAFSEGSPIAKIANLDMLLFKGMVNEADIRKIKIGMPVKIIIGALNNLEVNTKLSLISPKGAFRDGIAKFDIEADVIIAGQESMLAGFSANAEIVLERKDSILSLEEKYFIFRNDSIFVEIVDNHQLKQVKIIPGISDGIHTEIVSGLEFPSQVHVKE
ncbi:MAG: efflux RND transporter periplasmic adaptor subunit [Tannerella sp.]|jgi:HlyD family secretion protein|nr:efflux RND transporter periplasmic adaptor subunit [Tannerella sp.]